MASSLATIRTTIATALAGVTTAQIYRRRQTNMQYPCLMIGWPLEFDVSPVVDDDPRDATMPVHVGCEVTDDDSSDDLLSSLLESAVTALNAVSSLNVMPATDFGEGQTDDGRTIIWATLPVKVLA
jgi:hypothetical protein